MRWLGGDPLWSMIWSPHPSGKGHRLGLASASSRPFNWVFSNFPNINIICDMVPFPCIVLWSIFKQIVEVVLLLGKCPQFNLVVVSSKIPFIFFGSIWLIWCHLVQQKLTSPVFHQTSSSLTVIAPWSTLDCRHSRHHRRLNAEKTERCPDLLLLFKSGDRPLKIGHGPADEKGWNNWDRTNQNAR